MDKDPYSMKGSCSSSTLSRDDFLKTFRELNRYPGHVSTNPPMMSTNPPGTYATLEEEK